MSSPWCNLRNVTIGTGGEPVKRCVSHDPTRIFRSEHLNFSLAVRLCLTLLVSDLNAVGDLEKYEPLWRKQNIEDAYLAAPDFDFYIGTSVKHTNIVNLQHSCVAIGIHIENFDLLSHQKMDFHFPV